MIVCFLGGLTLGMVAGLLFAVIAHVFGSVRQLGDVV